MGHVPPSPHPTTPHHAHPTTPHHTTTNTPHLRPITPPRPTSYLTCADDGPHGEPGGASLRLPVRHGHSPGDRALDQHASVTPAAAGEEGRGDISGGVFVKHTIHTETNTTLRLCPNLCVTAHGLCGLLPILTFYTQ